MTLPGEHEVKSGSLPLQKVDILSSDYCEKTMEELLQESYVDMKARTSGIVSKLAFIKTMERGMYVSRCSKTFVTHGVVHGL